jgi:hypothetical protein
MTDTVHELSTIQPYWFRFKFPPSGAKWWRKQRRFLSPPEGYDGQVWPPINVDKRLSAKHERVEFERVEPGRFGWILSPSGARAPCIAIDLDEMEHYEIEPLYEEARRKRDPAISPHTALRLLEPGNPGDAFAFLEKFGPFWLPKDGEVLPGGSSGFGAYVTAGPMMSQWLNLDIFWAAQRRYLAVAELFGAYRGDVRLSLRNAWKAIVDHLDEINKVQPPLFDQLRLALWAASEEPPSIADRKALLKWLLAPDRHLRERTPHFVCDELNRQVGDCKPWWRWVEGRGFVMSFSSMSLWAIIGQLFARDTLGVSWRICPHCNRLFYPERKDRFFCTSQLQVLHSKREWARTHRKSLARKGQID